MTLAVGSKLGPYEIVGPVSRQNLVRAKNAAIPLVPRIEKITIGYEVR
jgi:hypothetical protein